jgi:hypothetical protein
VREQGKSGQGDPYCSPTGPEDPYPPNDYSKAHYKWLVRCAPQRLQTPMWREVLRATAEWRATHLAEATAQDPYAAEDYGPLHEAWLRQHAPQVLTDPRWQDVLYKRSQQTVQHAPLRDATNTLHLHVQVGPDVLGALVRFSQDWGVPLPEVLDVVLVRGCKALRGDE